MEGSRVSVPGAGGRLENSRAWFLAAQGTTDSTGARAQTQLAGSLQKQSWRTMFGRARAVGGGSRGLARLEAELTRPQWTDPEGNGKAGAGSRSPGKRGAAGGGWTFSEMGDSGRVGRLLDIHTHPCRTPGRLVQILACNSGLRHHLLVLKSWSAIWAWLGTWKEQFLCSGRDARQPGVDQSADAD